MTLKESSDAQLARACRRGDSAAWRELVRRHSGLVYRVALRMLRNRAEAEDASQEAFMRVVRAFGSYDASRPMAPWVAKVTYNVCLKRIGQQTRSRGLAEAMAGEAESAEPPASPEKLVAGRELERLVDGALDQISAQDRALLNLRYREGLSDAEVAEATDMPVGTVKTRIFRSRARLKKLLRPFLRGSGTKEGRFR